MMDCSGDGLRTIRLTVEYDGTEFSGWQVQPDCRTVQGEIERALKTLTREEVRVVGSGRTDAGVHALGQVVSFQSRSVLPLSTLEKGLNGLLPSDVRIIRAETPEEPFDARRDAVSRTYRYVLTKRPKAVGRQYAWYPRMVFSVGTMEQAAECLLGEHDFTSFCKSNGESENFPSRVTRVSWNEREDEICFEITALRFFHNMVRIIVGTLLEVGRGRISIEEFRDILEAKDRKRAGPTVPPQGLFLVRVDFKE